MYSELKKACLEANFGLPRLGLVIYTFGNASVADYSRGVFAIKPSGVAYHKMKWQDIAVLDFDCKPVEGHLPPSIDAPTHAELYRSFKGVGGIVHTHSSYAVAWAQAWRDIPLYGTAHADQLLSDVPCTEPLDDAEIAAGYEAAAGRSIVRCFRERGLDPAAVPMVLVGGHGPFAWGRDGARALFNARVLEELARTALFTESLNSGITRLKPSMIHRNRLAPGASGGKPVAEK